MANEGAAATLTGGDGDAAAAAAAAAAAEAGTGDGEGNKSEEGGTFFDGLSPENQAVVAAKKWNANENFGLNDLMDSYRGLEKLVGANVVEMPSAADPLSSELFAKLGAPAEASGYKIERPKMPDGVQYDEGLEAAVLEAGVGAKMLPVQMQALIKAYADHAASQQSAIEETLAAENQKAEAKLMAEWGSDYKGNLNIAKQAVTALGIEPLKEGDTSIHVIDQIAAVSGNNAALKLFHKIGEMMGEDTLKGMAGAMSANSEDAVQAEIDSLYGDQSFMAAYTNPRDPGHNAAVNRMSTLFAKKENFSKPVDKHRVM